MPRKHPSVPHTLPPRQLAPAGSDPAIPVQPWQCSAAAALGQSRVLPGLEQGRVHARRREKQMHSEKRKKQRRSTQLQSTKGAGAPQVREQKHRAGHCWVPGMLQRRPGPPGPHPPLDKAGVKPARSEVAGKGVNDLAHRGEVEPALGLPCATRSCGAVAPAPCRAASYWAMPTARWENRG